MTIIEILLRIAGYIIYLFGGYILLGALFLRCSIFATKEDTWGRCIKRSWINTMRMRPWYDKIEE